MGTNERTNIVLASASPRRSALLRTLGVPFEVVVVEGAEPAMEAGAEVAAWVEAAARAKAAAVAATRADAIVIAADTVVALDGAMLGKPRDEREAAAMLRRLSGRTHQVYTGLCVWRGEQQQTSHVVTQVTFRPLSEALINAYVATGEPMDKAGAYGIQGKGALLVEKIEGCYFNVVGLPLVRLSEMLATMGVVVWKLWLIDQ
ncbi:MAG: Maf family protein [Abditibacteriales bacterium]|nr:Maf family protein [Abditibacteriales bacterium]MDW8364487.1 Maf family protein [Abditibacteriales bacterium]